MEEKYDNFDYIEIKKCLLQAAATEIKEEELSANQSTIKKSTNS